MYCNWPLNELVNANFLLSLDHVHGHPRLEHPAFYDVAQQRYRLYPPLSINITPNKPIIILSLQLAKEFPKFHFIKVHQKFISYILEVILYQN